MIEFKKVTFGYKSSPPLLTEVSFSVPKGTFLFLSGPSGSGKTTLIKLILGLLKPDLGDITTLNLNTRNFNSFRNTTRKYIRSIFQTSYIMDDMTVWNNIYLPFFLEGRSEEEVNKQIYAALAAVKLVERRDVVAGAISAGERQRVAVAQAIVDCEETVLLIADEPTSNLDPPAARKLLEIFESINKRGATVVFCTHDLDLISGVSGCLKMSINDKKVNIN